MPPRHTSQSPNSEMVQMHHIVKANIENDISVINIRVQMFEMTKQKSKSAMENITILLGETKSFSKFKGEMMIYKSGK